MNALSESLAMAATDASWIARGQASQIFIDTINVGFLQNQQESMHLNPRCDKI
jgi:hypothetical protein